MKGPRLFDHSDWKSEKDLHVFRCPIFSENIGIVKSKKRYSRPHMFCFSLKVLVKKEKKVFIVRDETPHFLRGPRFQPA